MSDIQANVDEKKIDLSDSSFNTSGLFWGILFIYLGILLILENQHFLYHEEWIPLFVFGLGILMVGDYFVRISVSSRKKPSIAKLIFGILFILASADHIFYIHDWWPLLLVLIGGWMIFSSLRKKTQEGESA